MDIFCDYEEVHINQQSLSVNRGSSLSQHPKLQQPFYTEMLRNSSFTNAAKVDIDTL